MALIQALKKEEKVATGPTAGANNSSSWYDQYSHQLSAIQTYRLNALRMNAPTFVAAPSAMDIALRAMSVKARNLAPINVAPVTATEASSPDAGMNPFSSTFWTGNQTAKGSVMDTIVNSGLAKGFMDLIQRPVAGVGGALAGLAKADLGAASSGLVSGLEGKSHTYPSETVLGGLHNASPDVKKALGYIPVLGSWLQAAAKTDNGIESKVGNIAVGLASDVAADPVTYLDPAALITKIKGITTAGKAAETGLVATDKVARLASPTAKIKAPTSFNGTVGAAPVTQTKDPFSILISNIKAVKPSELSATGEPSVASRVITDATSGALTDAIKTSDKLAYPGGVSVPLPFRTVEKTSIEKVTQSPVAKAIGTPAASAKLEAAKIALAQDPTALVKGTKFTNSQLIQHIATIDLSTAKGAQDAKYIENLLGNTKVGMAGRTGAEGGWNLNVNQLAHVIEKGPKAAADAGVLADAKDINQIHIRNGAGDLIPLQQHLSNLGVTPGKSYGMFGIAPEGFKIGSKAKIATTKTVVTKSTVKLSPTDMLIWRAQHGGKLAPEDLKVLENAKNPAEFTAHLNSMNARTIVSNFQTLKDFTAALKSGAVPKETVDKVLKLTGARTVDEFHTLATNALNKTIGKHVPIGTEGVQRLIESKPGSKVNAAFKPTGVRTADRIVEAAMSSGEKLALSHPIPHLSPQQIRDIASALPEAIIKNLINPKDEKLYPFLTDLKVAKRTSKTYGKGYARNLKGWNAMSQSDVFRALVKSAQGRHVVPSNLGRSNTYKAYAVRASNLYNEVMPELAAVDSALKNSGANIIAGTDSSGLLISLSDVLHALPDKAVKHSLFNYSTSIFATDFMQAAEVALRASMGEIDPEAAKLAIQKIVEFPKTGYSGKVLLRPLDKLNPKAKANEVKALTQAIVDSTPHLRQAMEDNYAIQGIKLGQDVTSMTDPVIKGLIEKFADPNISIGETLADMADRYSDAEKIGSGIKAPAGSGPVARGIIDNQLANVLKPGDFAEAKALTEYDKAVTHAETNVVGLKQAKARVAEGLASVEPTMDVATRYDIQLSNTIFRANVPILDKASSFMDTLGRMFKADYGHEALHQDLLRETDATMKYSAMHHSVMANLHDVMTKTAAQMNISSMELSSTTMRMLQEGMTGISATDKQVLSDIVNELKKSVDLTFSTALGKTGDFASRNGLLPHHINTLFDYYGVPKDMRFDVLSPMTKQTDIWRTWHMKDPLDTLDRMHSAMQRATLETTLGRLFSLNFGADKAATGLVKLVDTKGGSVLFPFVDSTKHYPKEIVEQFKYLDDVMKTKFLNLKSENGKAMLRMYDTVIHMWKAGVTIYRPGHHVNNLVGDLTLAWLAGVHNQGVYIDATRIMKSHNVYEGFDGIKALQEGIDPASALAKKVGKGTTRVEISGKVYNIPDNVLWSEALKQGLMPTFKMREDLSMNLGQTLGSSASQSRSIIRPFNGKVQAAVGGISEARDHVVRIGHFIDAIGRAKTTDINEAFKLAGQEVRKWHPDGSDLSNFEGKVMRRSFMFYSWMRKALPLVVEAAFMSPGKVMVFPKAMYEMAKVNGVDPESLVNPFPADKMFPGFLLDKMTGPEWLTGSPGGHYMSVNPGEPVTQMLGQYGNGGAGQQLLGAISPVARVPIELMTGTSLGTGSQVTDKTGYVDSNVPFAGPVASITGISPAASLNSLLSKEAANGNTYRPGLKYTKKAMKGDVGIGFNDNSLANFLTGLGITDNSTPTMLKRAIYEKNGKG